MRAAIVDTGPLVAFLDRAERNHRWIIARIEELDPPLLVCEPVLAEAYCGKSAITCMLSTNEALSLSRADAIDGL